MKFIGNGIIELNKELSDLDVFTLEFVQVLRKHTNYVIVSGYVSILLGRARASEDIDILIPKIAKKNFTLLWDELKKAGFDCLNTSDEDEMYEHLSSNTALRFAKAGTAIPNVELKFAKNKIDDISLQNTINVKINSNELLISHLEMQIAFKETVLCSPKDFEDARHLRNISANHLNQALIKKYEVMLNEIYR